MNNEEHERNLRWLFTQIESQKDKTNLRSIVTYADAGDKPGREYLLSCTIGRSLRLRSERKSVFHVGLEEIENVVWRKRGLWMQLDFEIAARKYGLCFSDPESLKTTLSYAPKNWFGELAPVFMFNTLRLIARGREISQANFAEAEKWCAVFPDAEFPDTEIKNAKS